MGPRGDRQELLYWHIIWVTYLSCPPDDQQGDWSKLSELYGPLIAAGRVALCPEGLPDSWQRKSASKGQRVLSPDIIRRARRHLMEMVAAQQEGIAGGAPVSAMAVTATAVHLVLATRQETLAQEVGRFKSQLSWWGKQTWTGGFWHARLLDETARQAVEEFVRQEQPDLPEYPSPEEQVTDDLLWYAGRGDLEGVRAALAAGADINSRDAGGWTPLHWAADSGMVPGPREEMAALLLKAGADLRVQDIEGNTPLLIALRSGNADIVRQMVDAGAELEARNDRGETPLIAAAAYGNPATVALLLQRGADPKARTLEGRTARDVAEATGRTEVVRVLDGAAP